MSVYTAQFLYLMLIRPLKLYLESKSHIPVPEFSGSHSIQTTGLIKVIAKNFKKTIFAHFDFIS